MDDNHFKEKVLRLHDSRIHEVTNSLGVYDAYKYIRKNGWFDIERPLKEKEFYRIIREVNKSLAAYLVRGGEIKLPHKLGTLEIRKKPTRIAIVNGKLVTTLPIDWDATLKLWQEDEESYQNKTLIRTESKELFKIYYNKKDANYNNKSFYEFRPNVEIKKELSQNIKRGIIDAFIFKGYD